MSVRRIALISATALAAAMIVGGIIVWTSRGSIADGFIQRELQKRGAQAQYRIDSVGPSQQRLSGVVIGDPKRPDLTAQWVVIDTRTGVSGVSVKAIRAGGVRLNGRYREGIFSLGAVDKLLPAPTGEPFALPDIFVALQDARLRLDTPWGALAGRLDGQGNVASGFNGTLALVAPSITVGTHRVSGGQAFVNVSTNDRRVAIKGPLRIASATAGAISATTVSLAIDGIADERFARIDGDVQANIGAIAAPQGRVLGTVADARLGLSSGRWSASGTFDGANAQVANALLQRWAAFGGAGAGTPLEAVAQTLAIALRDAGRRARIEGKFAAEGESARGALALSNVSIRSQSGATLLQSPGPGMRLTWPGGLALATGFTLTGGQLPSTQVTIEARNGRIAGNAIVATMSAGPSRIALAPVRFAYGPTGLAIDTVATADGQLAGGMVRGLRVPVTVRGGQLAHGCVPVGFDSYVRDTISVASTRQSVCLSANSARVDRLSIRGRTGNNPFAVSARSARFALGTSKFGATGVELTLGDGDPPTRLALSTLDGVVAKGGATGTLQGAEGRIGNVPLLLSEGRGRWRLSDGRLTIDGAARVADANPEYRFVPVDARNLELSYSDDRIVGRAGLYNPKSGIFLGKVELAHRLSNGVGHADVVVPQLNFGKPLQPEELTPVTLGVIAFVEGGLSGGGRIDWTPKGLASTGTFRTPGMNMAAAFGPITGLAGEIRLSDMLGLETAEPQSIKLASVNPGIAVTDGEVRYRLLPGLKAEILGGRWPFAGGFLILEPTVLDLNRAAERRMTFRVEGLDMSRFIAAMEFENIAATGTFDGVLPMVFDKNGGQIEGGRLEARSGGTLAYVGELSNENIGAMGKFAFDALKSIKYNRLSIDLNGAIDGDVITRISFAGVNQAPIGGSRAKFPIPVKITGLTGIPFIFNVTITAKFRQLFEMARTFNDPSILINRMIPQLEPVPADATPPIQPSESEPKP